MKTDSYFTCVNDQRNDYRCRMGSFQNVSNYELRNSTDNESNDNDITKIFKLILKNYFHHKTSFTE